MVGITINVQNAKLIRKTLRETKNELKDYFRNDQNEFAVLLTLLVSDKPLTAYSIEKKIEIKHATLFNVIKRLEKSKCIKIVRKEEFRNTGMKKKLYEITPMGVGFFFFNHKVKIEKIEAIVEYLIKRPEFHSFIPKIKEWKLIQTPNLLNHILKTKRIFPNPFKIFPSPKKYLTSSEYTKSSTLKEIIGGLTGFLTRQLLNREFEEAEKEARKRGWDFVGYEYISNETLQKEAQIFVKNNPWMKEKIVNDLDQGAVLLRKNADSLEYIAKKSHEYFKL